MNKTTFYQKNSSGKVKVWSIWVEDNLNDTASIWVEHGQQGGKMQLVETVIYEGKNIGKANETTPFTQAVSEAQSTIDGKVKKGYVTDLNNAKDQTVLGSGIPQPMLANKFDPSLKIKGSRNLEKLKLLGRPIICQNKLDGTRCFIIIDKVRNELDDSNEIKIQFYSRSGDKYYNFPHIVKSIKNKLTILPFVDDRIILDGELYSHDIPFNQLSGLIRKKDRTQQDLIDQQQIKFFIYDIVIDKGYEERFDQIKTFVDDENIILTPSFYLKESNDEDIIKLLKEAELAGYEGLMIRQLGIGYEHKRTWQLTKYKSWVDEEYKIVGFKKSITGETLASIWFEDEKGNRFYAVLNGTDAEQKEVWDNQSKYLGRYGTVKYQELTTNGDDGVPRFGKCIKFRDKPGKD